MNETTEHGDSTVRACAGLTTEWCEVHQCQHHREWTPEERIELQEQTIRGLRAEVSRAVMALPSHVLRDGEPWEQGVARLVDEHAAVLRRVRVLANKYGPFPEVDALDALIAWAEKNGRQEASDG